MRNRNVGSRAGLYDCEDRLRRAVKELATSTHSLAQRLKDISGDLQGIEPKAIPDRLRMRFEYVIAGLDSNTASTDLIPEIIDLWADVVQSVKTRATRWHRDPINFAAIPIKKRPSFSGSSRSAGIKRA